MKSRRGILRVDSRSVGSHFASQWDPKVYGVVEATIPEGTEKGGLLVAQYGKAGTQASATDTRSSGSCRLKAGGSEVVCESS
jgi:hypothetical protein